MISSPDMKVRKNGYFQANREETSVLVFSLRGKEREYFLDDLLDDYKNRACVLT